MKVAVFYNNDAGSSVSPTDIRQTIEAHGHRIVGLIEMDEGVEKVLHCGAEMIVAAGGDGTVAAVARAVAGRPTPLAVLPLGTANNIAMSLGCNGPLDTLVAHWKRAKAVKTDLGVATGPWGDRRFVEGVGGGLVSRSIALMDAHPLQDGAPPDVRIHHALQGYLDVLSEIRPVQWTLRLDDAVLTGEYLLVEVLNIRSIGPNFVLAHGAELSDGAFTIVLAGESEREQLLTYWRARIEGEVQTLSLDTRHATEVTLLKGEALHIDDTVFPAPPEAGVRLWVDEGAINVVRGPFPR